MNASSIHEPLESRAHRRAPFRGAARVDSSIARCTSISTGGLSVHAWTEFALGQIVCVHVELPDGQVRTRAQVMRVEDEEVGLRFLELDQPSLASVVAYVAIRLGPLRTDGSADEDRPQTS